MIQAVIGAVVAGVSAIVTGVKGAQQRSQARRAQFQIAEEFHRAQVLLMREGSRAQLAATRQAALDAQREQAELLVASEKSQRTALMLGTGAVLLGMVLIAMKGK